MIERIRALENSIMELGSEVFRLKHSLSSISQQSQTFLSMLSGLKQVLDEKGLVSIEDFEEAVDLKLLADSQVEPADIESEDFELSLLKKAH